MYFSILKRVNYNRFALNYSPCKGNILHTLVKENNVSAINQVINRYGNVIDINKKNIYGDTPLSIAIALNNRKIIQLLSSKQN